MSLLVSTSKICTTSYDDLYSKETEALIGSSTVVKLLHVAIPLHRYKINYS